MHKLSEILTVQLHGPSIQSCINDLFDEEEVNQSCINCKNKKAIKSIKIVTEPATLILQLKRYKYDVDKGKAIKLDDTINVQNH